MITNILSTITILSAIGAMGYIEDCKGHCLGNENWTMFFIMILNVVILKTN